MQHVIHKQVIQLTIDRKLDAFQVQHQASENYWRELVPLLQKTFDDLSNDDEVIQIDRLEIDLKNIAVKDIENGNWKENVSKQLIEQFEVVRRDATFTKIQSTGLSIVEQWLFYMQYGHLHWSTVRVDDGWRQQVLDGFAANSASLERLRRLMQNNDLVVRRIVLQHTEPFLQTLIERLTGQTQNTLSNIVDEIAEMMVVTQKERNISASEKKQTQYVLWQQVLRLVALEENRLSSESVAMKLLQTQFGSDPAIDIPFLSKGVTAQILKKLKEIADIDINKLRERMEIKIDPDKKEIPTIDEEGIFVQNAGIILLHPFLNAFFKNLGLVAEGRFIDESSREKALYLLHFLATGKANAEEHELVMEKVLCEWSLENPVSNSIELTAAELTEANELLMEAIQQWDALKNTSPAGLREGFLQRMGKLYTKNSTLQLQIESNSIDVLLDYLPWNLSIVHLPWMKDLLKVEWR